MNTAAHQALTPALMSSDEEIQRLLATLRTTTATAGGDMALLAEMLDDIVAYCWSDNTDDRMALADDMADLAVKIRDCADREHMDAQNRFVRDDG